MLCQKYLKGTVDVILSDSLLKKWHAQFTTVPFKSLFEQQLGSCQRFSILKSDEFC